jgi:hypothetical protein
VHFDAQGANNSKSLFIIPKFDLHADIQLLKVGNEQKSLGFTVGHGRMIAVDTLSTLGLTLLLIPLSCVVRDWGHRSPSGYEPFCCLAFGLAVEHQSLSARGGAGIYFHLSSATHHQELTDPLNWVDRSTLIIYFLVPPYLPTLELIQMSRDPLPYPPQMRNGGSPPAHLPPSLDTLLKQVLAEEQICHAAAMERAIVTMAAVMKRAMDLAMEKMWAAMLAALVAANEANKQCHHDTAACEKAFADNAKAQRRRESAERTAALAESVSAVVQSCQESENCAAVLAETTLANERHCREAAKHGATLAKTALAEEQRCILLVEVALAEYGAQTKASRDAAVVEVAKHTTTLAVMALAKLKAGPNLRYGGPPPTHFLLPLTAAEVWPSLMPPFSTSDVATRQPHGRTRWPITPSTTSCTRHELCQQQPCHIHQPCCPPPPPYDLRGCGPFYNGGEHSCNVPCSGTIGYIIAYH